MLLIRHIVERSNLGLGNTCAATGLLDLRDAPVFHSHAYLFHDDTQSTVVTGAIDEFNGMQICPKDFI